MKEKRIIPKKLREKIEARFGDQLKYNYQCMSLEHSIYQATGEHLGLTTLKRIMGFASYPHHPRRSTLDILSKYAGYADFEEFLKDMETEEEVSSFEQVEKVEGGDIKEGESIKLMYHPDRVLTMKYLGEDRYEVTASQGSKLQKGDILRIRQIAVGFELLVSDVERDGRSLGTYIGARSGGVVTIKKRK